jgi:hypothetical protein
MRCEKNEIIFSEGGAGADLPYRVWMGDLFRCPQCNAMVIAGVGKRALADHYRGDLDQFLVRHGSDVDFYVEDC